jgi:hypothetical protein
MTWLVTIFWLRRRETYEDLITGEKEFLSA